MKLRVRGNSIRLRLTKTEVADLSEHGVVEESVQTTPVALVYRIERVKGSRILAHFDGARISIKVPETVVRDFCDTDRVGFEGTHEEIRVLVEKDWQCLAPREEEDESDAFPHPQAKS